MIFAFSPRKKRAAPSEEVGDEQNRRWLKEVEKAAGGDLLGRFSNVFSSRYI